MKEPMTSYERIHTAWNLREPDRVPATPVNCYIVAYQGGLTIREMLTEPDKFIRAAVSCLDILGDQIDPNLTTLDHLSLRPKSGWDQVTLDWRIWDEFPPHGNIPSSYFDKAIVEDYNDVLKRGFAPILFNRKLPRLAYARQNPDDYLYYEFQYPRVFAEAWRRFVEETGVALMMGGRATIPFEYLMYYRTFPKFVEDLIERPEKVLQMCDRIVEYEMTRAMEQATIMGAGEVPGAEVIFFQAGIVGPPYVSPGVFNDFVYPSLKKGVDTVVQRGFKVHVHMDGDLTAVLPTLRGIGEGLPVGRIVLDFEKTDMKKAKEVLGERVCIHGNVPSALLVYGSVDEVEAYCKRLIQDCAKGGGFLLSTECEVPWDARRENVRARVESAKKFGQY